MNSLKHALFTSWLATSILSIFIFAGAAAAPPVSAGSATNVSEAQTFYLDKVNTLRAVHGLAPVNGLAQLQVSATQKTNHMATKHYWSHYGPDGMTYKEFISTAVPQAAYGGENLAKCYPTRQEAFDALVASPSHYKIMVGNFTYMGIGETYDEKMGCTLMAMHFARF
jgi:uncharacterized protein YkwD